jgi:hypothetical protein
VGLHEQTVRKFLQSDPKHAAVIAGLREINRTQTMTALQRINPKLTDRFGEAPDQKASAKDLDALSRALLNIEKTAGSVAGENRPAPVVAARSW